MKFYFFSSRATKIILIFILNISMYFQKYVCKTIFRESWQQWKILKKRRDWMKTFVLDSFAEDKKNQTKAWLEVKFYYPQDKKKRNVKS